MVDLTFGPDRDLTSIHEARLLANKAIEAQTKLADYSQEQVDILVNAMATAATEQAQAVAQMAVEETGYGIVADKVKKNLFASQNIYEFIRPIKTVGVIRRLNDRKVIEIAEPFGVVAAVIPSTNPTSTAIYKILISIKARCAIILSPHPSAIRCITQVAEVMADAARCANAPEGIISWMKTVTLEGTQELMKQRNVAVILATGGMGLVRAAYSAGKPAYGVGPGNAPAYIESSADISTAVRDIMAGKTFDNGLLCSSENSVVVDKEIADEVRSQFISRQAHFLSPTETSALTKVLVTSDNVPNPQLVGRSASKLAQQANITVPDQTRVLIAPLTGVGKNHPLSMEKLCPVLSFYTVRDWQEACDRCKQILKYGGMGHTMAIHSTNEKIILEFGLKKPAFRVLVNTPTSHGSIGLTTGLDPSLTLGCGGYGGNITSDNITPRHLLNIKRLAYGIDSGKKNSDVFSSKTIPEVSVGSPSTLHSGHSLSLRIDEFLASRGYRKHSKTTPTSLTDAHRELMPEIAATPAEFVCEEDVRNAIKETRNIVINEQSIVTPAARDLAEQHNVFIQKE